MTTSDKTGLCAILLRLCFDLYMLCFLSESLSCDRVIIAGGFGSFGADGCLYLSLEEPSDFFRGLFLVYKDIYMLFER